MRIAILIAELTREGGGERQALCLARELCALGHQVVIYTAAYQPDSCYPGLASDLQIVSVGRYPLSRLRTAVPGKVALYLDMMRLAQAVAPGFDLLNPHAWPAHWAAVRAAKRARPPAPPVVWMCNDYTWEPSPARGRWLASGWARRLVRYILQRYDRRAVSRIDRIAALSHLAQRQLKAGYGVRADVVRSGTDVDRLEHPPDRDPREIRERHRIPEEAFLLLFLGILMPHRRLEDALEAVARLVGEGRNLHFLVVGSLDYDPAYAASIREHAGRLGLAGRVSFAGSVPEGDIASYYWACDAFVFPNEEQTWSLAVTEAMACGKPVIVSTGVGVHEVLANGRTALLFPPRRPALLAHQIELLMDDATLARAIGEAGRRFVASTLTWRRYALDMLSVFSSVAGAQQGVQPLQLLARETGEEKAS